MDRLPLIARCAAVPLLLLAAAWPAAACSPVAPGAAGDDAAVAARDARWLEALRRSREALAWTDVAVRHDWRLQRQGNGPGWRILDPQERAVRTGTEAECRRTFADLEADGTVPGVSGPAVILLHGLGEGRGSMQTLADHLRPALDATVMSFGYASVLADVDAHARALGEVLAGLPSDASLSFVGHSLGNLVVRRWLALADPQVRGRVRRMVMLGPPNQGSELARLAGGLWGVAPHARGAARDLAIDWQALAPRLAVPDCEFGIVAGGKGDDAGFSPLLAGDDDAVVRVDETRLAGARDFLLVPVEHAALLRDPAVLRATAAFLATGRFAAGRAVPAERRP